VGGVRASKADRGDAGIDDKTIAMFEQNLSKNLCRRIWKALTGRAPARATEETFDQDLSAT
jgi:hypothetical protein